MRMMFGIFCFGQDVRISFVLLSLDNIIFTTAFIVCLNSQFLQGAFPNPLFPARSDSPFHFFKSFVYSYSFPGVLF